MSDLRSEWTSEQVEQGAGEAHEGVPEARTTDRYPVPGRASGVTVSAGEIADAAEATTADGDGVFRVPADPPRGTPSQGGE